MANKDDIDLDNLDLDDFDFDIPEWNADTEVDSSSRSPVDEVVNGTLTGLKQELTSPQSLRRALSMALPDGYGLAADTIENVATDARSLYDKVTGESPELVRGSKSFGRKAMNLVGNRVLPKKVSDRLNNALEDHDDAPVASSAQYKQEQEAADLAGLAEIFKAKASVDEERATRDEVENLERKGMEQARFKSNIEALSAINRSLGRLVGYQDKVTARYQHKMLELNYRQYTTTKQLTDLMVEATSKQTQLLETIRHNTALPEAVKIRGSEMFGQLAKQRLMGNGLNSISNWSQNYIKQTMENVSGMVQGVLDPLKEGMAMTEDIGMSRHQLGGQVLGSMIGSTVRDHASMYLSPYLANNKILAKTGEKLRKTFTGLPQQVNEYAQSETQGSGFKSVMTQMFKSFLPQFSLDSRTGGDSVESLDEVDKFDKIARRSLIEIIPGYLSEIAHWSRVAVTGEKDSAKQVYNVVRGGFTAEKDQLADVGRQIMSRSERDSLRTAADDFLKTIGGDVMSSKAQRALKRKLLDELANGRDLKPDRLADPAQYPNEDVGVVDEITSLIIDSFGLDYEGKQTDTSEAGERRFNDIRDQFLRMSNMIPASGDRIRILGDVLGKDSLRKLGYIERQGREDRINFDKIWSSVLDEDGQPSEAGGPQGGPNADHSDRQRTDRVSGVDKVRGDLTRRADRADSARLSGHAQARLGGLERYLGDKSTLIALIRESRDFHAETVGLLKGLPTTCCDSSAPTPRIDYVGEKFQAAKNKVRDKYDLYRELVPQWTDEKYTEMSQSLGDLKQQAKDIWVQGEDHPRLQEWKLKAGQYRDKVTGETLKRWEDIQGDVVDLKNRTILEYKDLVGRSVIADNKGRVIKHASELADKFKGSKAGALTQTGIQTAKQHIAVLGDKVNNVRGSDSFGEAADKMGQGVAEIANSAQGKMAQFRGKFRPRMTKLMRRFINPKTGADVTADLTGEPQEDMVTLMLRSVQLQYETLKQVTPEKVRKNSFTDMFARRKELVQEGKDKLKGKFDSVQGLFAKGGVLAGLMNRLKGGDEDEGDEGGGVLDSLSDLFGDGSDGEGRSKRKNRRRAKRKGKLGRLTNAGGRLLDKMGTFGKGLKLGGKAVGGAAKLGWGATKLLGKGLGLGFKGAKFALTNPLTRMVAGTAGRLALGALMGAAGLVSAPVLAGVAIAGTALAAGAYIYSATRDKLAPLTRVRMAQYGVHPKPDSTEVKMLMELEKLFAQHTSVDAEGKASVNVQSVPFESVAAILKLNVEDPDGSPEVERAIRYIKGRFSAVYLLHVSNYYVLTKSLDLSQVDGKLKGKVALDFLTKVSMKDRSDALNAMVGPFEDEDLDLDAGDVEDHVDDARKALTAEVLRGDPSGKKAQETSTAGAVVTAGAVAGTAAATKVNSKAPAPAEPGQPAKALNIGHKQTASSTTANAANLKGVVTTTATVGSATVVSVVHNSALATNMDDSQSVRYRTYGLTEITEIKMYMLATLENNLWSMVNYDKDKQASLKDLDKAYEIAEALFLPPHSEEAKGVYIWFHRRFVPTFLAYCSAVRVRANIDAKDAAKRLKTFQLVEVLRETVLARDNAGISVWDIEESPWKWYVLNADAASTDAALDTLYQKVTDKELIEPEAIHKGQIRDKDGNLVVEDPSQTNRPATAGQSGPNSGAPQANANAGESESGVFGKMWSGVKGFFGGDKEKAPQQGGMNSQGQSVSPGSAVGPTELATGTPVSHPGGGSGGNINDIPEPKGDGWEANKETLMAAANMVGIDPSLAASIAGVESNYRPNALPYKNPRNPSAGVLSSAASYYQVIKGTWKDLMGRHAAKYGINPDTTQHDPRANALLGLEYLKENIKTIKGAVKRNVTDTDVYLAHFLGPGGAKRFLSAPPTDPAINHVGAAQAKSNPAIFRDRSGRPRSVAAVYNDFDEKIKKHRKGDAPQVAQTLKTGEATQLAGNEDAPQDTGSATPAETALAVSADATMPSMVKPAVAGTAPANSVVEAPAANDTVALSDKADARQTQTSPAGLMLAARTADAQSSNQAKASTNTYGGLEGNLERLVGVNESQLQQLITLVELVKGGGLGGSVPNGPAAELVAQGTRTTQSPTINTPKAAARGTVSVGRV